MVSDCNPSWSAIWLHTAGSYPSVVSMRRRTSVSGDLSSRNRRTAVRSSSCSSLKAKFMWLSCPLAGLLARRRRSPLSTRPPAALTNGSTPHGTLHQDKGGPEISGTIIDYEDTAVEGHRVVVGPHDKKE